MPTGPRVASGVGAALAILFVMSGRTSLLIAAVALLFVGTDPDRLSIRSALFSIEVRAGRRRRALAGPPTHRRHPRNCNTATPPGQAAADRCYAAARSPGAPSWYGRPSSGRQSRTAQRSSTAGTTDQGRPGAPLRRCRGMARPMEGRTVPASTIDPDDIAATLPRTVLARDLRARQIMGALDAACDHVEHFAEEVSNYAEAAEAADRLATQATRAAALFRVLARQEAGET